MQNAVVKETFIMGVICANCIQLLLEVSRCICTLYCTARDSAHRV